MAKEKKEIKMRVNRKEYCICHQCGKGYKNTREMYDIKAFGVTNTICYTCLDELVRKSLRMQSDYNAKLKSKEDLQRAKNEQNLMFVNKYGYIEHKSINEVE